MAGEASLAGGELCLTDLTSLTFILCQAEGAEKLDVEHLYNEGKADIDVCWNSRADICKSVTK